MKLMHALRPRRLMQAVNILRDHTAKDALLLKFGELLVRLIRFRIFMHHLCSVKIVEDIGMRFEERMAHDHLRRIRVRFVENTFGTAEIGDAAFCRNPCSSEEHDALRICFANNTPYFFKLFVHIPYPHFLVLPAAMLAGHS